MAAVWASFSEGFVHHFGYLFRYTQYVKKCTAPRREHQNTGYRGSGGDPNIMPKTHSKIILKRIGLGTLLISILSLFWHSENLRKSIKSSTHSGRGFGVDFGYIYGTREPQKMHLNIHLFLVGFWMRLGSLFGSRLGAVIV